MNQSKNLKVTKFVIARTGAYNDMMYRPYHTNISEQSYGTFLESTRGEFDVSAASLSGVAGSMLKPVTEAQGTVPIANGWDTPRIRFMITVEIDNGVGYSNHEVIAGYTDYAGVTADGANLDPNMRLWFNSTTFMKTIVDTYGGNNIQRNAISEASLILAPALSTGMSGFNSQASVNLMRPMDILGALQVETLFINDATDYRSEKAGLGLNKSRRKNGVAPDYLARAINAINHSQRQAELVYDGDTTNENIYSQARNAAREPYMTGDAFLRYVAERTDYNIDFSITYGQLCTLFPEIPYVKQDANNTGQPVQQSRGVTANYNSQEQETIIATILSNSIPGLMLEHMLTYIVFEASNDTPNGSVHVKWSDLNSFSAVNLEPYAKAFAARVVSEVIPDLTFNGQTTVSFTMVGNILGDSSVSLSYNNGPMFDYIIPSFSDATFAPVISPDLGLIRNAAHDIGALANMVSSGEVWNPQPTHAHVPALPNKTQSININPTGIRNETGRSRFGI